MKYLVTGGAGFIGSHITRALLGMGTSVRILDNFSSGKRENVEALIKQFNATQLEILEGDVRDASRVTEAVRGVEIIFHEAAFVSVPQSMDQPQECFDVNITGTSLLFDAARKVGVRRVVVASSAAVYGESDALPLVEETPLQPLSPYAVSKRVDEMYAELFTNSFGLDVTALRYFNVYGPRQRPDSMYAAAVSIFARRLLDGKPITVFGDGGQTRSFCYVTDLVDGLIRLSASEERYPVNLGNPHEMTILHFAESIQAMIGSKMPIRFHPLPEDDPKVRRPDISKAQLLLGWEPKVAFEDGIQTTIDYFRGLLSAVPSRA